MRFRIIYEHPETGKFVEHTEDFHATVNPEVTAREWAEDLGYALANKGWYKVDVILEK